MSSFLTFREDRIRIWFIFGVYFPLLGTRDIYRKRFETSLGDLRILDWLGFGFWPWLGFRFGGKRVPDRLGDLFRGGTIGHVHLLRQ
jgi:hypothetical protein